MAIKPVYLTNTRVAWEIPPGRIAGRYLHRYYLSPPGWDVTDASLELLGWVVGVCGELRREARKVG